MPTRHDRRCKMEQFAGVSGPTTACVVQRYEDRPAVVATSGLPCYILAPEHDNYVSRDMILLVPLYDGEPEDIPRAIPGGKLIGFATIPRHAIVEPLDAPGFTAASDRAAAYRIDGLTSTRGVILVLLRLPNFQVHCISCRTVHYFFILR